MWAAAAACSTVGVMPWASRRRVAVIRASRVRAFCRVRPTHRIRAAHGLVARRPDDPQGPPLQHRGCARPDEARFPAGFGPPLHIHHREDEALYVLDGELHCRLGDQELTAGLGQLVFGPRELAHTFKAGPSGARALVLLTPAGFKQMFQEGGIPAHTPPRHRPGLRRPTGDPAVGQVRHGRHRPAAHLTASGQLSDRSEKHALVLRRHWYWRDYGRHR